MNKEELIELIKDKISLEECLDIWADPKEKESFICGMKYVLTIMENSEEYQD